MSYRGGKINVVSATPSSLENLVRFFDGRQLGLAGAMSCSGSKMRSKPFILGVKASGFGVSFSRACHGGCTAGDPGQSR